MRILDHVGDREIGFDIGRRQHGESEQREGELRERSRSADAHQRRVVAPRADKRHDRLDQRQRQREDQRIMADFRAHGCFPWIMPPGVMLPCVLPVSSFQWPCFFRASATSFGI